MATKSTTKSAATKSTNPFRPGSSYWAVVESLRKLGMGKMHSADAMLKQYPLTLGAAAWKAFQAKDVRNANGKGAKDRVVQNATVVNRPDYGFPLREIGFEVRKARTDEGQTFGLFQFKGKATPPKARTPKAAKAKATKKKVAKAPKAAPKVVKPQVATGSKRSKAAEDAVLAAFGIDLDKGIIPNPMAKRKAK